MDPAESSPAIALGDGATGGAALWCSLSSQSRVIQCPYLLKIAQIVGDIEVLWHRVVWLPGVPGPLHHARQDFA
jgi:hypothetical protein